MTTLQERIEMAFANVKTSKKALADAIGIAPPSLNQWFSGKTHTISYSNAVRAAAFLGVNPQWLAEGTCDMYEGVHRVEGNEPILPTNHKAKDLQRITMEELDDALINSKIAKKQGLIPPELLNALRQSNNTKKQSMTTPEVKTAQPEELGRIFYATIKNNLRENLKEIVQYIDNNEDFTIKKTFIDCLNDYFAYKDEKREEALCSLAETLVQYNLTKSIKRTNEIDLKKAKNQFNIEIDF